MSADQPIVSVIIAVQNGERFLAQAIESVLARTYQAFEIIVVDGRSTDRTEQVAKSYARVRYVQQAGQDLPDAYNTGIDAARGNLLAFLSHDDLWLPQKLSRQVEWLSNDAEIQYAVTQFKYFLEPGHALPPGFRPELLARPLVGRIMETLMARKPLFDRVGRLSGESAIAHDVDWYARAKDKAVP